ncbi:hypothetical protein [Paraburkholderia tropica]|uniref:hypothetical protein n=1 Tax=Paraburkholderia tropica TaxID=92647 RepID=UPI002AB67E89|nr:hypothetical protein [Paraburkholderia tropica]
MKKLFFPAVAALMCVSGMASAETTTVENALAKGNLCELPGKGVYSEGAIEKYQGKSVRCLRTQAIAKNDALQDGRLEWIDVREYTN